MQVNRFVCMVLVLTLLLGNLTFFASATEIVSPDQENFITTFSTTRATGSFSFAAENSQSEYDQLIALACEVFPEYSSAILNSADLPSINSRSVSNPSVVSQETRQLSESEALTVAQLSSDDVIVISSKDVTIEKFGQSTTESPETGVSGRVSFNVAAYGYLFKLLNVNYTIENYSNCNFTSPGTVSHCSFLDWNRHQYTSTNLSYTLKYGSNGIQFFKFRLYFNNNQLIADID